MIENYTLLAKDQNFAKKRCGSKAVDFTSGLTTHVRFVLLAAFLLFGLLPAVAQVSVTATGGTTSQTYATVNAAFTAINAGTHTGAITITVTANTTEPATAVQLLKSGSPSSYTSILIKPGSSGIVINSAATPTNNRGILEFVGADNVTIDGSANGTSSKDLTIQCATSTATNGPAVIRLSSNSTTGTDGADNITIKNCIIVGARSSATDTNTNYGIVFTNGTANISANLGAYSSTNTVIQNNNITRCWQGIYGAGFSATYPLTGLQILNNTFSTPVSGTFADATSIGQNAIYLSNTSTSAAQTSAIIRGNDIRAGVTATGYSNNVAGIQIAASNYGVVIENNYIHDVSQPSTGGYAGAGIYVSAGTNNTLGYIRNNIIRDMVASNYSTANTTAFVNYGIWFYSSATGYYVDHNTVALQVANTTGSTSNPASNTIYLASGATGATLASLRNNIIINTIASTNAMGIYVYNTASISSASVNNNNYYVPTGKIGYYTANRTTLSDWQTATSKDGASKNVLPSFISSTDLHLNTSGNGVLESAGIAAGTTGISTDYDGETRPGPTNSNGGGTAPDIGADEFDGIMASPCTAPSAAASVAAGTVTTTTIPGTITAPATAPTGYIVVYSTSATLSAAPVNGTSYTTGTALGGGTVGYAGTATTFTLSSLTSNTQYYVFVYSYNSGTCTGGPVYATASVNTSAVTCAAAPTALSVASITSSGATVSWTASAAGGSYGAISYTVNIYSNSGYSTLVASFANATSAYAVTGLAANTLYYYQVVATNGSCTGSTNGGSFTTACAALAAPTAAETFATYSATDTPPSCWSEAKGAVSTSSTLTYGTSKWLASTGFANTGSNIGAKINLYSTYTGDWLISPPIDLGSTSGLYRLSYSYAVTAYNTTTAQSTLGSHILRVIVSTDGGTTWSSANTIKTYTGAATYSNTGTTEIITLPYSGTIKIAFVGTTSSTTPDIDFHIDNFVVETIPTCSEPTAVVSSAVTNNSATVSWTASPSAPANGYEYYYSTSSATPAAGVTVSGTTAAGVVSTSLSSLSGNTTYYVWVRSVCDTSIKSNWSIAGSFTTLCDVITSFPWTDGFESLTTTGAGVVASCWKNETGTYAWYASNAASYSYHNPRTGTYYQTIAYSNTTASYLWTPGFQLTAGTSYDFSFYFAGDGYTGWTGDVVYNTTSSSTGATTLGSSFISSGTTSSASYTLVTRTFVPTTSGTYYFAVKVSSNSTPWYLGVDDFQLKLTPTCFPPTGITVSPQLTAATISWTAPTQGTPATYEYEVRSSGAAGSGSTGLAASGSTTAPTVTDTATGLSAGQTYSVYLRSNCGSGNTSDWSTAVNFSTLKTEPTNYATNFAVSAATTTAITTTWTAATGTVLPDGYSLKGNTSTPAAPVDGTDAADTTLAALPASKKISGATTATGQLTAGTAGTMYYISNYTYTNSGTNIDFKTDGTVPTLNYATRPAAATAVTLTGSTTSSASLSWTLPATFDPARHTVLVFAKQGSSITAGTPTYGPDAYTASADFSVPGTAYQGDAAAYAVYKGTGTTTSITGLTATTAYYIRVVIVMNAANYDSTYTTSNAGTTNFTTPCPPITSLPWTENFDSATTLPSCWSIQSGTDWTVATNSSSSYDTDAYSGSNFLREAWTATNEFVWSPGFALTAGTTYRFSFYWAGDGSASWTGDIMYNSAQSATGNTQLGASFATSGVNTSTTYQQVYRDFTPTTTDTYYFAIRVNASSDPWYLSFDDFSLNLAPSCTAPTDVTASIASYTAATVSWTAATSNPGSGYDYYYSTSATAPTDTTTPTGNVATTSVSLTGLTANTTYYVWVRSVCGGVDMPTSSWTGTTFYTGYCVPTSDTYSDYINSFTTTAGAANISNTNTSYSATGYTSYTSQAVSMYPGGTVNFSAAVDSYYGSGFSIWVDWNDDLTFASTERVYTSAAYIYSSASGTITVPAGATVGSHRMRIMLDYGSSSPANACSVTYDSYDAGYYGEVEDYTFTVIPVPTCYIPTGLAASVSATTLTASWTAPTNGITPVGYEYVVTTTAGTPVTNGTATTATSFSVSSLSIDTTYYVYVRTNCGSGTYSDWSSTSVFVGYCVPTTTYTDDYISAFSTTAGTQNASYTASSQPAGSYQLSTQTIQQYAGSSFNFSTTYVGGTNGVNIWIDWNNDLVFDDATEKVFTQNNTNATKTGSITIPLATTTGNYRMRVRGQWGSSANPPACGNVGYGSTIDFTLNVQAPCYTWTGATSTAWATTTNWCGGVVPTAASDITIPATANNPVIASGVAYAHNLTLGAGATLTVSTG
ncbi:fibronectin type III domain-containing protein, partial [Flavobacterium sp. RHBU_3]|uniref:fibronectin type III domain-containing protein n=1 Tax=Flavobacterium sp. RHBU_3 TaxID=3391184 RepID=UPI0039850E69